jgi:hypothetical protein
MVDGVIAVPARKIPPMAEPSTQPTAEVAAQVQARRGSERAADLIEQICRPS